MAIDKVSQSIYVYKATLIRVKDADTIECLLDLGFNMQWKTAVRFSDVDAWETHGQDANPLGNVAKTFLTDLFTKYGPSFYLKSDKDEVAIYNRVAGKLWLETTTGTGKKAKRAFIDVIATLKANGFDEAKDPAKQVPYNPEAAPRLVIFEANDIMDLAAN